MGFFKYCEGKIKGFSWYDLPLMKLSVAAFTLMVAKIYPEILGYDWYVYFALGFLFGFRPIMAMFK